MKKVFTIVAVGFMLAGANPVQGQVQFGGYLAYEFLKGQKDSAYPKGSLDNLQAGLFAAGPVSGKFGFTLEIRSRTMSLFEMEQAWVGFLASNVINIKAGLYLVPFGQYNVSNRPHETPLISTPINLAEIHPASWRDLGLLVEGRIGVLTYAGYIGNGLGESEDLKGEQVFKDNNSTKAWGGRIGLLFSQSLSAGFSYYAGKYDDTGERRLTLEGVDVAWVTQEWEVRGEWVKALIENPDLFEDGRVEGFTIWTSMFFRSFHPIGSFQKLTYEDPFHGPGFLSPLEPGAGIFQDRTRWTAGLRYVLGPGLFIKIEYNWNKDKNLDIKDDIFLIQAALSF